MARRGLVNSLDSELTLWRDMDERDLFTVLMEPPEKPTVAERFARFHADNPHVYRLFIRFTREVQTAGLTRYSAYAIFHRLRWHLMVETTGEGGYRLNNDIIPHYVRMAINDYPEFSDLFELRMLHKE